MSELENIEELEIKIENLSTEKDYLEESMAELEIQHKKQRKELAEEYEREKRRNIERIRQMQNTTYEEQQKNPSFWDSLKERISKSKFISSLIIFKMELDKKIPIPQILSDLKYFSKDTIFIWKNQKEHWNSKKYLNMVMDLLYMNMSKILMEKTKKKKLKMIIMK